jgi:hypothetical protein
MDLTAQATAKCLALSVNQQNQTRLLCVCRPAGDAVASSSDGPEASLSYEVAAVHASHATLLPPGALQQPAQPDAEQCAAEDGGSCRAAGSQSGGGSPEMGSSAHQDQGSTAAASGAPVKTSAAPAASPGQAAENNAAVRHIVTLKNGREWRFAAIWRGGGIAVWREDGAACSI